MFRVTWPRWLPSPYMEKPSKMYFFGTKRTMKLKLGIKHRVLKYYQTGSNDDPCLTLSIFMIWSNLFPNASARAKLIQSYISYIQHILCTQVSDTRPMVLRFLLRLGGLTALGQEKALQFVHDHIHEQVCSYGLNKDLNLCGLDTKHRREETIPIWSYSGENQILQGIPVWSCMRGTCNILILWCPSLSKSWCRDQIYLSDDRHGIGEYLIILQEVCSRRASRHCHSRLSPCLICSECI